MPLKTNESAKKLITVEKQLLNGMMDTLWEAKHHGSDARKSVSSPDERDDGMEDKGICRFCLKTYAGRGMKKHLLSCKVRAQRNQDEHTRGKKTSSIYHLRIQSYKPFWLHIEIKSTSTLVDLDTFLRDIWLEEECGHLSMFKIGGVRYTDPVTHESWAYMDMNSKPYTPRLRDVLKVGDRFDYEYDFGSTTHIDGEVIEERKGVLKEKVRILARNKIPREVCSMCENEAVMFCAECQEFYCAECIFDHLCGDEGAYLFVNSPRMGVCGYTGEYDWDEFDVEHSK